MTNNEPFPAAQRAEILSKAADLLENNGWCRGHFRYWNEEQGQDNFCTVGALQEVLGGPAGKIPGHEQYRLQLAIQADIAEVLDLPNSHQITKWNDRHRIGGNVVAKLRKVAAQVKDKS